MAVARSGRAARLAICSDRPRHLAPPPSPGLAAIARTNAIARNSLERADRHWLAAQRARELRLLKQQRETRGVFDVVKFAAGRLHAEFLERPAGHVVPRIEAEAELVTQAKLKPAAVVIAKLVIAAS